MPSEVVKKLWERRNNVVSQTRSILERAAEEGRDLSTEEEQSYQRGNAEIDALDKRVQDLTAGEARAQESEEAFARLEGRPVNREQEGRREEEGVSDELRAFLRGERRSVDVVPERGVDFRALAKGSGTGGSLVPTSFYNSLVQHMIEVSGVMQAGPTVLRTSGGEGIQIPKTTAHGTATLMSEAGTIPTSEPTFGQITLGAFKYGELIQVSRELIDDDGVDLQGYLAQMAGRALGNALGNHLVNGTGSTMPRGILLDAGTAITGPNGVSGGFGTQSAIGSGFDLLIDTYHSVISPYRTSSSCAWLMADNTAASVRKIKNADGVYAWQPSVTVGRPDTILGKPVYIDPFMPAMGTSNKPITFGDFSQYFVRLAGGIRFERSDEFAFNTDLVTFRALLRGDGALVDTTGALKSYRGGTA